MIFFLGFPWVTIPSSQNSREEVPPPAWKSGWNPQRPKPLFPSVFLAPNLSGSSSQTFCSSHCSTYMALGLPGNSACCRSWREGMRTSRSLVEKPKAGKVLEVWLQNSWCLSFPIITCNFLSCFEWLWPTSEAAALAYLKIVMVLWLFVTKIYSFQLQVQQLLLWCQILNSILLICMSSVCDIQSESHVMQIVCFFLRVMNHF